MTRNAVAVGVFDGVHIGHRAVLDALIRTSAPRVVTFDPHPVPGTRLLLSVTRRVELIRAHGIRDVVVVHPDSWTEAAGVEDATLVRGPRATSEVAHADEVVVPLVEGVSSERIRRLVAAAELGSAARLLGRSFEVEGIVVEGDRRGKPLGFPTANLRVSPEHLLPPKGIYAGAALGRRAAVSVGVNPHFGGADLRVEVHLLDFDEDLYGTTLVVELWQFLRPEAAFESETALVDAIRADVEAARAAVRPV